MTQIIPETLVGLFRIPRNNPRVFLNTNEKTKVPVTNSHTNTHTYVWELFGRMRLILLSTNNLNVQQSDSYHYKDVRLG